MHPKQICKDFKSIGSPLSLEGDDLFILNPENVYPELEEFAKSYKAVLIKYLQGEYSDHQYNVDQTIEKIIDFYRAIEQPINRKIDEWLNSDQDSLDKFMTLCLELSQNGWTLHEPISNYQNEKTENLSEDVYKRAMAFFKGG